MAKDGFGWPRNEAKDDEELEAAMAALDSPIPEPTAASLCGSHVVDDGPAQAMYPGCWSRDERLYPGLLVPAWAIELRGKLERVVTPADRAWLRVVMQAFGVFHATDLTKAKMALAVASIGTLANPGRARRRVTEWLVANGMLSTLSLDDNPDPDAAARPSSDEEDGVE